jgi:hypothetical protein
MLVAQERFAMLTIFRRALLLWLFLFWQGGFLFYGAVVVTIGSDVLGSDFAQGLITRRVAIALNITGFVVLLAWIWDLVAEGTIYGRRRWAVWIFLMLTLAVLTWLHPRMDELIDANRQALVDGGRFRHLHRWYLRTCTAQWIGSLVFTVWTLQAWRASDGDAATTRKVREPG